MAAGPVPGNGIPITLPAGKTVFWSAAVQAAESQFVQVQDAAGTAILTATGKSSDGRSPTQIGQGWFATEAGGDYTVWLGFDDGRGWSSVLASRNEVTADGSLYFTAWVFAADDGADADFNDTLLQLQWFEKA